jgi:hypothetical protein
MSSIGRKYHFNHSFDTNCYIKDPLIIDDAIYIDKFSIPIIRNIMYGTITFKSSLIGECVINIPSGRYGNEDFMRIFEDKKIPISWFTPIGAYVVSLDNEEELNISCELADLLGLDVKYEHGKYYGRRSKADDPIRLKLMSNVFNSNNIYYNGTNMGCIYLTQFRRTGDEYFRNKGIPINTIPQRTKVPAISGEYNYISFIIWIEEFDTGRALIKEDLIDGYNIDIIITNRDDEKLSIW